MSWLMVSGVSIHIKAMARGLGEAETPRAEKETSRQPRFMVPRKWGGGGAGNKTNPDIDPS